MSDLRASNTRLQKEKEQALRETQKAKAEIARLSREHDEMAADLERMRGHANDYDREVSTRQLKDARRRITELENALANEQEEARSEQDELRRQLVVLQREVDTGRQTILDLKGQLRDLRQSSDVAVRRAKLETQPGLERKRAVYSNPRPSSNPASRPSSAERRRPSPARR